MIVQTIKVNDCTPQTIVIGRRGTYDTLQIAFDLSYLVESYGNGVAVLAVKRSQDSSAYPAVVTQEDATLLWTVNETDTAYVGSGECQLMWYVDGGLAKTIIYPMVVMRDILSTSEEPPDGYENWIEHLTGLGAETQQNAQNAAQSATEAKESEDNAAESARKAEKAAGMLVDVFATATTLEPGEPATAEYDDGVFKFGIPKGTKGDKLTYADLTEADKDDLVQGPILEAQTSAVSAVGTAKTNAVNAVNQAGGTQVNAVNQAGATQVQAVEDKGDEVIDSIPPDYSDLTAEVDDLSRQISDETTGLETKAPVILETASGAIASFSDGADSMPIKKLVANIEPVQDLHGYDSPWPGGGGENLFRTTATGKTEAGVTWTVNDDGSITVTGTSTGYTDLVAGDVVVSGIDGYVTIRGFGIGTVGNVVWSGIGVYTSDGVAIGSVTGGSSQETFVVNLADYPNAGYIRCILKRNNNVVTNAAIKIQVSKGQTAPTAWTPYSNLCPISGWTGMTVYDDPAYGGTINWNQLLNELSLADPINWVVFGGTGTIADDVCNVTLTAPIANLGSRIDSKTYYDSIAGHKYYITFGIKTPRAITGLRIYYDAHSAVSEAITTTNSWVRVSKIVTPQTGYANAYLQVFFGNNATDGFAVGDVISVKNFMLCDLTAMFGAGNEPTTTAEFEALFIRNYYAYNAGEETTVSAVNGDEYNQISVNWETEAGTVYGGNINLTTGVLTADTVKAVADGTQTATDSDTHRISFYDKFPTAAGYLPTDTQLKCNRLKPSAYTSASDVIYFSNEKIVNLRFSEEVSDWNSFLASNPVEFTYKVANPVTVQLDPITISTLYSQNNIFADTGNVEVTYPADTKLYIDNKITQAIAAALNA